MNETYIEVTTNEIKKSFIKYNSMYFDDLLEIPNFKVINTKGAMGKFTHPRDRYIACVSNMTISINKRYNLTQRHFDTILIHEMIHQYTYQNHMPMNHRDDFRRKADEINLKYGWNIQTYDNSEKTISNECKKDYNMCCYYDFKHKFYFIFRFANNKRDYFESILKRYNTKMVFFTSRDEKYDLYPNCTKNIRGFKLKECNNDIAILFSTNVVIYGNNK